MDCQPCSEQSNLTEAKNWCKHCEEALCENCTIQHKAFKLSKHHIITILRQHAKTNSGLLKPDTRNQLVCTRHPDKGLEYLCPGHQIPICLFCKREDHKECLGVEKIEDAVDNEKVSDMKQKVSAAIQDHKLHLETHLRNEVLNFNCLKKEKEQFLETMMANRRELNDKLDELENELKQKKANEYQHKAEEIESVIGKFNTEINSAKSRLTNLKFTNTDRSMPLEKQYLDLWKIKDVENALREKSVDMNREPLVIPEYKFSYHVSEDKREIHVIHFIATKALSALEQDIKIISESGSSVIELEPETQVSNNVESITPEASEILKPSLPVISNTDLKLANVHKESAVVASPNSSEACTNEQSCEDFDHPVLKRISFKLKHSFSIEGGREDFFATDMKLMFCKSKLAVVDDRFPRFLIYTKSGHMIGCVRLPGKPDSIALIDNQRAAVTLIRKESVTIVDTDSLTILSVICVDDCCKGILFYNNQLIVNCTTNGLRYMTTKGSMVKCEESVKGDLYLHADKTGTIYSAMLFSKKIAVCDINGRRQSTYHLRGLEEPYGLTTDRNQILFVSCHKTHKILCKQSLHSSAIEVLNQNDGISGPVSIDYDATNDELFVVNDYGSSIYIFGRE